MTTIAMPPPISCRRRERMGDAFVGISSRRRVVRHRRGRYRLTIFAMELSARTVTLELAETFVIARESSDTVDLVEVEIRHDGLVGYGEAAPIERYGETVCLGGRVARAGRAAARRRPVGARRDPRAAAGRSARRPRGRRRSASRRLREAGGRAALPAPRPETDGAVHVLDDLARRSRRHGAASRGGRRQVPAAEAQARRP